MRAFIDYCMNNPILTVIMIVSAVLMLLFSGIILAMPDHEDKDKKTAKDKNTDTPLKESLATPQKQENVATAMDKGAIETAPLSIKTTPTEESQMATQAKKETKIEEKIETTASAKEEPVLDKTSIIQEAPVVQEAPIATETPVSKEKAKPRTKKAPAKEKPVKAKSAAEEKTMAEKPKTTKATAPTAEDKPKKKTTSPKMQKKPTTDNKNESKEQDVLLDDLTSVENVKDFYEEDETDRMAKYSGKWVICRVLTEERSASDVKNDEEETYFFELHASNGEKLLSSEEYTTYNGALRGIETHKTNILRGNFKITTSKKGNYIFKLLSGKNLILCMGENYPTKAACESAIESAKRFAKTAVLDENIQDHVVKVPVEDDTQILPLPDGYNGKWIVSEKKDLDGETLYYFELFANNGEKLLSSEDYTTYVGAVNGIQTHKSNISDGNFRVSLTKRGDYIYKLLNKNGQLLCLGEHYKTKRLCLNAVESVKRFALNSPVLTNIKPQN